jgi:hypothetical protein
MHRIFSIPKVVDRAARYLDRDGDARVTGICRLWAEVAWDLNTLSAFPAVGP